MSATRFVSSRPSVVPPKPSIDETQCSEVCNHAGAQFVGIQRCLENGLAPLVLFADRRGSCLAVPLAEFSADAVRRKLSESAARWKVPALFVLAQFPPPPGAEPIQHPRLWLAVALALFAELIWSVMPERWKDQIRSWFRRGR